MTRLHLFLLLALISLQGCSSITMLRTREIRAVGSDVDSLRQEVLRLQARVDSMAAENDRMNRRLRADLGSTNSTLADQTGRLDGRLEEVLYRLDLLISKSDKILSKKVVIEKRGVPGDSTGETELVKTTYDTNLDGVYNSARTDFQRGEYKLAYDGFKQVYETVKEGELAENSLYWMASCLAEAGQQDKAMVVYQRLLDQFPQGRKSCIVLTRLADGASAAGKPEERRARLEKILQLPQCAGSNEAGQAQEELLGHTSASPSDSSKPMEVLP